jgi:hypothetical protein
MDKNSIIHSCKYINKNLVSLPLIKIILGICNVCRRSGMYIYIFILKKLKIRIVYLGRKKGIERWKA